MAPLTFDQEALVEARKCCKIDLSRPGKKSARVMFDRPGSIMESVAAILAICRAASKRLTGYELVSSRNLAFDGRIPGRSGWKWPSPS